MSQERAPDEYRVQGSQLVDTIRDLIHEGNVRRIKIRHEGRTLLEIPLTIAAIGALIAPMFTALGTLAALAAECTIVVERSGEHPAITAGDAWPELSPGDTTATGGMEGGSQTTPSGEPPTTPDVP